MPQGAVVPPPQAGKVPPGSALPVKLLPASGVPGKVPAMPAAVRKRLVATLMQQLPASLTKAHATGAAEPEAQTWRPRPRWAPGSWLTPSAPSQGAVPVVAGRAGTAGHGPGLAVGRGAARGRRMSSAPGLPQGAVTYSIPSSASSSTGSVSSAGSVSSSQTVTFSSAAASPGPGIGVSGLGGALLSAARPVHGSWGSGRLLRTSLVSVLITDSGEVLIGAVPKPSVLYADAAQLLS